MPVSGTRGPIPRTPEAREADWKNEVERRIKGVEGGERSPLRGLMPRDNVPERYFVSQSNSAAYTSGDPTDMAAIVTTEAGRFYKVCMHSQVTPTAASDWTIAVEVDGVSIGRIARVTGSAAGNFIQSQALPWINATTGQHAVILVPTMQSGTGTISFTASAGPPIVPRYLWVEDWGELTFEPETEVVP